MLALMFELNAVLDNTIVSRNFYLKMEVLQLI